MDPTMVTDEEREWLTTEMARLIQRVGLDSYVAAPLVEATDQWFPDEWHRDDGGVVRLAKRVFGHAGLTEVALTAELGTTERALEVRALDAEHVHVVVDADRLTDPLTIVAELAYYAASTFRARHDLRVDDTDEERRLIELTTIYLGFGILMTNAAYRYRASGELRGNTAITRWSHDEQGALPAAVMAYALAQQLVARGATPGELRAVRRQLETNQADVFDNACRQLKPDYVVLALGLPARSKWPARREPPPAPTSTTPRLWRKEGNLPTAVVKSTGFHGRNAGRAVLRVTQNRRSEFAFVGLFASMFATIPLAVKGYGGAAMGAMAGTFGVFFLLGGRIRRDVCSDPDCGARLTNKLETCPRCGGRIAGTLLPGENRLEAEERLALNQADYDMDVGEPSESGVLPEARVHSERRDAAVD
jgi:hypothetical protein